MDDELRKPIKWDRPCYKCGSHYCDLSCPDRAKNANAAPQDQAKDAARWRFLTQQMDESEVDYLCCFDTSDWAGRVDAAMQQEQKT